ncbi:hypothetical protein [Aquisphaera insulae]|uniref:hypothetical protein n=1 Tax=Aquisphaera insulae TaxID=2712864 RepID=UPI0013ED0C84|nr:hypothetical protein [Aquisphaera insulae]
MSRTQALLLNPTMARRDVPSGLLPIPVLIRIPRADGLDIGALPSSPGLVTAPASQGRRVRRRLRRELRVAGCAILAIAPILTAASFWEAGRAARLPRVGAERADAAAPLPAARPENSRPVNALHPAPAVLLSVEAIGRGSEPTDQGTVVFPGYLLPDDGREEAGHEGS